MSAPSVTAPPSRRVAPRRRDLVAWLVSHTRTLLPTLGVSVVARICNQLLGVALLVVMAGALGRAAEGHHISVGRLVVVLVAIALLKAALRYLEHYAGHWVAFTALQRLRELFFVTLVPQAPAATRGRAGAELTHRATRDIDRIEVFFAHTLPPAVSAVVVPVVVLLWLGSSVDAALAWVIVPFMLLIVVVVPVAFGPASWRAAQRIGAGRGRIAAHLGDDLQGARDVVALGAEQTRLAQLAALDAGLTARRTASGRIEAARAGLIRAFELGSLIAVLAVAGPGEHLASHLAVGLACAAGLWPAARGVDDFVSGLDAALASTARVRAIVDSPPAVTEPAHTVAPSPTPATPALEFRDVTLAYSRTALADVSFAVEPGEHVCVVGVSGSGKSSLATLLLRGFDPQAGQVLVGGVDVKSLPLEWLRRHVALAPQTPTLLRGTIADNLRLGRPDADDATVARALWTAGLDTWIGSLPEGINTTLGERGQTTSGGQAQRLGLARALVADPELIILDEVLSQLDAATASTVRERLPRLTTLEITHRADLLPDDLRVIVLDAGQVVQEGLAGDLRRSGGPFTRLEGRYL